MNEKKPTWNCPVCDKKAFYENLVIDGYFQQVLESTFLSLEDSEIQLHNDGSWSTHKGKFDTLNLDTPIKASKIEVIQDDLGEFLIEVVKSVFYNNNFILQKSLPWNHQRLELRSSVPVAVEKRLRERMRPLYVFNSFVILTFTLHDSSSLFRLI